MRKRKKKMRIEGGRRAGERKRWKGGGRGKRKIEEENAYNDEDEVEYL